MSKIIQFNKNEEENCCPTCDLTNEYLEYVKQAESEEELFDAIHELVLEAKDLGQKELLILQVNQQMKLLDCLHGECDCEDECH